MYNFIIFLENIPIYRWTFLAPWDGLCLSFKILHYILSKSSFIFVIILTFIFIFVFINGKYFSGPPHYLESFLCGCWPGESLSGSDLEKIIQNHVKNTYFFFSWGCKYLVSPGRNRNTMCYVCITCHEQLSRVQQKYHSVILFGMGKNLLVSPLKIRWGLWYYEYSSFLTCSA